jgi:hypothetical protein
VPSTCLEAGVEVGTVVVVVVVLTALTGGCVVVVVGANALDAAGSLAAVLGTATACDGGLLRMVGGVVPAALDGFPAPLLVCVDGPGELLDDVVDVVDGAIVDRGIVAMPEGGALSPVDTSGIGDPLATAELGLLGAGVGEPVASAKGRITTMPTTAAVPIPFCRCLMFISNLSLKVDRPLHPRRAGQLIKSCTRVRPCLTSYGGFLGA